MGGDIYYKSMSTANYIAYLFFQSAVNIYQVILWQLPPLIIQILIEKFKQSCCTIRSVEIDGRVLIRNYENLSHGLKNFLLIYYFIMQSFLIMFIFFTFSSAIKKTSLNSNDIMMMAGAFLNIAPMTYTLVSLTNSIEECFGCIENVKQEALEKLLICHDKAKRQLLKYLIQKIDYLKPMNARGYFTVDKSTLTSMLSVR